VIRREKCLLLAAVKSGSDVEAEAEIVSLMIIKLSTVALIAASGGFFKRCHLEWECFDNCNKQGHLDRHGSPTSSFALESYPFHVHSF